MTRNLNLIEESNNWEKIVTPFLSYIIGTLIEKKRVAVDIFMGKTEDILLIEKAGFSLDSIFAGLSVNQIEYFAKHAPIEYKKELISIFQDQEMINGVWGIVQSMDQDAGDGSIRNMDRIKKVIQYIQDNRVVFQT